MLGKLKSAFGLNQQSSAAIDSNQPRSAIGAAVAIEPVMLDYFPARQHAELLLEWLQSPGGKTGTVEANQLAMMHREFCEAHGIEAMRWNAVGRELRKLLNQTRQYAGAGRVRVYRIPKKVKRFVPSLVANRAA